MDVLACQVNIDFGFLYQFVDRQCHVDTDHIIDMAGNAFQFAFDVVTKRRGNVEVEAGNLEVHTLTPSVGAISGLGMAILL
ncbi:hypothetical protein D3C84_928510 [compost metagenome]